MAQTALNVEIEHLERLKARKREYEEESGGLLQGKLDLRAIEENKEALLKMDSLVAAQCIRVDKAKENGGCQRTNGRSHEREENA